MSKISKLGKILNGKSIPSEKGIYPAFGGNGVIGHVNKFNFDENTVVIGRVGANCGAVHFSDDKCWVTDNALAFIVENANPYYVYLLLQFLNLNKYHIGSSQPLLTQNIISNIEYNFVDNKLTQDKVALVIKSIDRKISNNNKINAELESLAKTIYDYWFLQFEFPNEEGKPYKSSGGKMVWNEELKREIPEGWRKGSLSDICSITMGASPNGESLNENQNGLIFYQGKADFSFRFPSIRMFTTSPIRYAKKNDVLISVRAPVGDLNIANNDCCIGRGLAALHSSYPSYLYYKMVSSKNLFSYYNQNGTTFGAVTKENLHNLEIVVPNEKTIMLFEKTISPLDKKISILSQENQELSSLRDFLLPMLMNGQITFR